MSQIDTILKIVAGGFTGYITNTYAINMLFKSYTPLKLGGVIVKTREKFIWEISHLVEERLVNDKTLKEHIEIEELNKIFKEGMVDFYEEKLPKNCQVKIQKIRKGKESINQIKNNFIKEIYPNMYHYFIEELNKGKTLNILDEKELSKTIEIAYQDLIKHIESENPNEIIKIPLGIKEKTIELGITALEKNQETNEKTNIEILIDKYLSKAVIKNTTDSIFLAIQNQQLKDWIGEDQGKNLLDRIVNEIKEYLKTEESNKYFEKLASQIKENLKNSETPINEWLEASYNDKLQKLIACKLPKLIQELILWIGKQESNIEEMLQTSIDEVVENTKDQRGPFIQPILQSKTKNIVKDQQLMDKIISALENAQETENISNQITDKILNYINQNNIGNMINSLENQINIKPEYWVKGLKWILNEILNQIKQIPIDKLLEMKLNQIIKFEEIKKESISKKISGILETKIKNQLLNHENWWTDSKEQKLTKKELIKYLKENQNTKIQTIAKEISIGFDNKKLGDLIGKFQSPLENKIEELAQKSAIKIENTELTSLLKSVGLDENWLVSANKSTEIKTTEILEEFLNGQVQKIVASNLTKLDEEELCNLVHDFMGRELKPITYFGAMLGGITGLGLAGIHAESWWMNMGIFGLVGYLTNVIALQMLFKPYEPIKGFSKLPILKHFDQGYIMKNKQSFGENLGKIVAKEMLDEKSILEHFNNNKDILGEHIKHKIQDKWKSGEYFENESLNISAKLNKYLNQELKEHQGTIKTEVIDFIQSYLNNENNQLEIKNVEQKINNSIEKQISQLIINLDEKEIDEKLEIIINDYWFSKLKDFENTIAQISSKEIKEKYLKNKNKSLLEILGNEKINKFESKIIEKIDKLLKENNLKDMVISKGQSYLNTIDKEKMIQDIANGNIKKYVDEKIEKIQNIILEKIFDWLDTNRDMIAIKIDESIQSSLGFFEKIAYSSANGSDLVKDIIDHTIDIRLPVYLELETKEVKNLISDGFDKNIWTQNIGQIREIIEEKAILEDIGEFIEVDEHKELLKNALEKTSKWILNTGININLYHYGNIFKLETEEYFEKTFSSNIIKILETSSISKADIQRELTQISKEWIDSWLNPKSISEICLHSETNLENKLKFVQNGWLDKFIQNELDKNTDLKLIKELKSGNIDISLEKEFKEKLNFMSQKTLEIGILNWSKNKGIDKETEMEIIEKIKDSLLDSLEEYIPQILNTMDLKELTESQINDMTPAEIHDLFNSFAKNYFRKLEGYGWLGSVFGLAQYLAIMMMK